MFCPKCGAQTPDNAAFCGSCGSPIASQPEPQAPTGGAHVAAPGPAYGAPAEQPTPIPAPAYGGGPAVAPKPGISSKTVLIALIAIAAVVVIAIIVGFVTCSGGGGKVNLNSMLNDKPEQVAGTLNKMTAGKVNGTQFYTANDDMKDLMKDASDAFGSDKKEMKNLAEDIKKQNPWGVVLYDDERSELSLKKIEKGDDPAIVSYVAVRTLEKPTCEDIAKIVGEVYNYNKIIVGYRDNSETFSGAARDDKTAATIFVSEYEDVYQVSVMAYHLDEAKDADSIEDQFDSLYDDHDDEDFDEEYIK